MSRVTLQAVARQAGISEATASRVLSGQSTRFRIPPETEQAVLKAARALGYSMNRRFYKPAALRSRTLGLIVPDLSHFFLAQLARKIIECARQAGFDVLVCDSLEDTASERKLMDQLAAREIDGLLLLPVGKDWQHVRELSQRKLPVVLLDRVLPDIVCHCVSVDNYHAAYRATEYLIDHGHRRIGCIQRLPHAWINEERVRGYREAHRAHGLSVDDALVLGSQFGQHNGYLEVKRLLEMKPRPSAIFALSHLVTLEALRALRDHGLSVPKDISLVGFDEVPHAEFFCQPITTVRQPIQEMGRMAVDMLLEQIERPATAQPMAIQLPCELVRRQSVATLRPARPAPHRRAPRPSNLNQKTQP